MVLDVFSKMHKQVFCFYATSNFTTFIAAIGRCPTRLCSSDESVWWISKTIRVKDPESRPDDLPRVAG